MKKGSKKQSDPTLRDVIEVINDKFSSVEERFGLVEKRIDSRSVVINERMDSVDARLGVVERRLGKIENTLGDIQEDLASALHATDNDGTAIINHEKRIAGLEKIQGIKPLPPKHLAGFE